MSKDCEHGGEAWRTSDGTPIGRCTDCTGEMSYFGDSINCGACYVGRLHTLDQHEARVAAKQ